jgi:hypothetical protein
MQNFMPYRVESLQESSAPANGLLTAYYEPVIEASRTPKRGLHAKKLPPCLLPKTHSKAKKSLSLPTLSMP